MARAKNICDQKGDAQTGRENSTMLHPWRGSPSKGIPRAWTRKNVIRKKAIMATTNST